MFSLQGRIAIVTGAASGIGLATAEALANGGASVVLTDSDASGEHVAHRLRAAGAKASFSVLDVTDAAACERLASRVADDIGPASILINNAGIMIRGRLDDPALPEAFDRMMDVNVRGVLNATLAFLPSLRLTRGCIVNVASVQSYFHLQGTSAGYTASKGAVAQLTKALAVELAPDGIRVNAVAPGFIETGMNEAARRDDPERAARLRAQVPLGRWGTPDDVAGPIVFLASDVAKYVTGVVLPIDGGRLAA